MKKNIKNHSSMVENRAILKLPIKEAFNKWLELTRSFSKLTNQEISLLGSLLYHRHLISKDVKSEMYINKLLFSTDTKRQIRESLGLKPQIFLNLLSNLRSKKVIELDSIKTGLIPKISNNTLKVVFEIKLEEDEG